MGPLRASSSASATSSRKRRWPFLTAQERHHPAGGPRSLRERGRRGPLRSAARDVRVSDEAAALRGGLVRATRTVGRRAAAARAARLAGPYGRRAGAGPARRPGLREPEQGAGNRRLRHRAHASPVDPQARFAGGPDGRSPSSRRSSRRCPSPPDRRVVPRLAYRQFLLASRTQSTLTAPPHPAGKLAGPRDRRDDPRAQHAAHRVLPGLTLVLACSRWRPILSYAGPRGVEARPAAAALSAPWASR